MRFRGWRLWGGICCGAMFAALPLVAIPGMVQNRNLAGVLIMLAIAAGFGAMAIYYALLGQRYRVTFHEDAVELDMVFKRRRVMRADVTGWTWGTNDGSWSGVVFLHLKDGKRVELPLTNRKADPVNSWFDGLENAEAIAEAESVKTVLADRAWGTTPDERLATLNRERRISGAIDLIGLIVILWILVWPEPYLTALTTSLALPVVVFIAAVLLNGRWAVTEDVPGDQRPNLYGLIIISPFPVLLRAANDFRVVDYGWVMGGALVCGVAGSALASLLLRRAPQLNWGQALLAIPFAFYTYGAAVVLNVYLDRSQPQTFAVDVIRSEADEDKDGHLAIAAWGPYGNKRTLDVSYWLQQRAPAGSKVCIRLHRGLFGVRWWTISPIEASNVAPSSPAPI